MKSINLAVAACAAVSSAQAAVLTTLPTPVQQGGMIHINISLQGSDLVAHPESGTPVIQPLAAWSPGDTFDAASPWYSTLDPSQSAGLFNSQFGLLIDAGSTDPLPDGSKIMVGWVSGTANLDVYQWKNTAVQAFNPMLGTDGSSTEWDWSTVSHGMMHPLFVMPAGSSGAATATLSFTLTDSGGVPLAGYNATSATLNFTVVPEPSALVFGTASLALLARRKRTLA
ncbi:MAG: hypothetical protein H7A49_06050 [Akkermansiaceae bacterium]|nr:hypothetical protein [Akkermansiaceae bacterium]MCP5546791.1 hypothetical protein [Akkermansiaceae bacterium]